MIWCTPISAEVSNSIVVDQRLLPHPDMVCFSGDHLGMALIAVFGLLFWCVVVPLTLFRSIFLLADRQNTESFRRYGYFIEGYEPKFWWWDILVKRADIGLMNIVTFTSLASDEKAKLILYPVVSGTMLAIAAWYQPFANTQAAILDFIEMSLLSFRFFLFSMIALLLIFHPSSDMTFILGAILVVLLGTVCCYFGLHVLVQLLRRAAMGSEITEDSESDSDSDGKSRSKGGSGPCLEPISTRSELRVRCFACRMSMNLLETLETVRF